MKKLLLTFLVGILSTINVLAAEQTASFSLTSYTVSSGKATITSSDNANVSLLLGRDGGNIGGADSKGRGFRVQTNMYFEITVPTGKYITKVEFTSGNNANKKSVAEGGDNLFGDWSITGESNNWQLSDKANTYTWTNGGTNISSPMKFMQTGKGDIYVSAVKVYYDDAPTLANEAPTIKTQPTNKTTVTDVATILSMAAEGVPTPAIQWYSCDDANKTNAQKISGATSASYDFQTSTAGTYYFYAVAKNSEGEIATNVVSVTVSQSYVITFSKGDNAEIIGTIPAAIRTNGDLKITTPKYNYSLSLAGKTFTHWTDGENNYLPNTEYTLSKNVTVTPVFENNRAALDNLATSNTVKFIKSTSIAATYQSSNKNAIVEQLTDNGKTIDVALIIQNGKFDLQPTNSRAQTNVNTIVSIPVVDGAVIKIGIYDNNSTKAHNCTINGVSVKDYLDGTATTTVRNMTYTYHGEAKYIDYVVNANNMYANNIDVTYPGLFDPSTTFSMKTAATGNVSIAASASKVELPIAANLTINGGSVAVSNGQSSAKNLVTSTGFSMTNGNTFFTVTLDSPLQAGDVITATMSDNGRGLKFATADAYSDKYPGEAATDKNFSYVVTDGDGVCGETTFNVFRATGNNTTFNNFKISRPATVATANINAKGYGTFSCEYNVLIAGAKVYKAAVDGEKLVLTEVEGGKVPAGEGVILYKEGVEEATTATALYTANAPAITGNALKATTLADGTLATMESCLVLSGKELVRYTGAAFAANKAYLPYDFGGSAKGLTIVFDDEEATAINGVAEAAPVAVKKFFKNGQLLIKTAKGTVNAVGVQVK